MNSKYPGFHKLSTQPIDDKIILNFNYIKSYEQVYEKSVVDSNNELSEEFLEYVENISKKETHKDILVINLLKIGHIYHTSYQSTNADSKKVNIDYFLKIKNIWVSDFYTSSVYPILYEIEKIRIEKFIDSEKIKVEMSEIIYNFSVENSNGVDIGITYPEEVKNIIQKFIL